MPTVATNAAGDGTTPSPAAAPPRGGPVVAVATALTLAIVAGYVFVSASFTLPPTAAQAAVRQTFAPYFSQQWNVFAPNIMRSNRELQVQVQWREDGELVHSEWIDVTETEFAAARGIPLPSRISKSSFNAAQAYMSRYNALSSPQKTRVRDTFIEAVGGGEFAPIQDSRLLDEIDAAGSAGGDEEFEPVTDADVVDESAAAEASGNRSAVVRFLRYDYMLVRFASAFGSAYFDQDVERVRWRVETQRTNDFLHRFDDEPQSDASVVTFGWRQPGRDVDPEVLAIFDDVVERYTGR
ncbi:DUF5819 family protein [Microbacterium sp. Gd 4-13]|uniref:DUF5819 family protein n=1 Tax=Microbacterium sp. Gd 4-13 TaxID=2173179 RepID=UPI001057E733|nr:DUF5819 family protein [Microbacterium sp. Gd 4-13]